MTTIYREAMDRIDELLARRLTEGLGPGLSLALTTRDTLLATRVYGTANADTGAPVTEHTLFQIGSITKHFTAAACLRLYEQGRLDLQAPVSEVLDWFEVGSPYDTPVTIHHLLTHTGGLVMMLDTIASSWGQTWALRDTELGFEPGSEFHYSNVGYNVLQCVIETITGKGFDASLRELVFEPLGMHETYGEIRNGLYERMAMGHKYSAHDDRPVARPEKQMVVNWYELSEGCGSVVTSPSDLSIFLRMLLNGGVTDDGARFLQAETYELMTREHAVMRGFFEGTTQGYGVLIEQSQATGGHRRILGGGENLGFETAMYGDLDAGVGVIIFCNSFEIPWNETRYALSALVAAAQGEAIPDLPEPALGGPRPFGEKARDYVGTYRCGERAFTVGEDDEHLSFTTEGDTVRLEPIYGENVRVPHPDFDHAMLTFGRNETGEVIEAFQLGDHFRNERYDGPEAFDVPDVWHSYVGQYRGFGLLITTFRFFIRKGQLVCQSYGGYADNVMTDLGHGTFCPGRPTSPERFTFDCLANGKTLRCIASGCSYWRVD